MQERTGVVTFKGKPVTLLGPEIRVGDKAPDFRAVDGGLAPVTLSDFKGKIKVISSVPSLDTPICDMETRRFNQEAAGLPEKVVLITLMAGTASLSLQTGVQTRVWSLKKETLSTYISSMIYRLSRCG